MATLTLCRRLPGKSACLLLDGMWTFRLKLLKDRVEIAPARALVPT